MVLLMYFGHCHGSFFFVLGLWKCDLVIRLASHVTKSRAGLKIATFLQMGIGPKTGPPFEKHP